MRIQYNGIELAMTGADVPLSATPLWALDAVITATVAVNLKDADGNIMAILASNSVFHIPGGGHHEWGDEARIDLSQYSANAPAGTVYIAYSVRT